MSAPGNIATGQVTVNSIAATQIVAARTERVQLFLRMNPQVLIGPSGVTAETGFHPPLDESGVAQIDTAAAVFAIAELGSPTVEFIEIYTP